MSNSLAHCDSKKFIVIRREIFRYPLLCCYIFKNHFYRAGYKAKHFARVIMVVITSYYSRSIECKQVNLPKGKRIMLKNTLSDKLYQIASVIMIGWTFLNANIHLIFFRQYREIVL